MIYRPILIKTFAKIPDTTNKEVSMVVDSITHINELSFRDAVRDMATKADIKDMATKADIKDMATKADIRDLESRMATKDDIKYLESKMATKDDITKSENKMLFRLVGLLVATIVVNLSLTGIMLQFLLPS